MILLFKNDICRRNPWFFSNLDFKTEARFGSPHPFLVRGASYPFFDFGAVRAVFRKNQHCNGAGSDRAATVREATLLPQSGAWRSELVLVRLRPAWKDSLGEAGSCPWLPSSSHKASPHVRCLLALAAAGSAEWRLLVLWLIHSCTLPVIP